MTKKALIPGVLAGMLLVVFLLYASVASFAYSPASYPQTPPYDEMARALSGYLSGEADALADALFTQRERLHMEDVRGLFTGGRRIALGCLALGLVLCVATLLWGGRRRLGQGLLIGVALLLGIMAGFGLWAVADFDGWFTRMHEWIFTNDLWLLDPAESLLINMLPLDFFIGAVKRIALGFAIGTGALAVVGILLQRRPRQKETV